MGHGDGDQHGEQCSMEMEITMRIWAILIHNHVFAVLVVLLHYVIKSFMLTVEVE